MKTSLKTLAILSGLLLLTGCGAVAQDSTPKAAGPDYGPFWRHEQMVQARQKGEMPAHPMMMMRGMGPGLAMGEDGKIDTTKLPPWCPYNQAAATPVK